MSPHLAFPASYYMLLRVGYVCVQRGGEGLTYYHPEREVPREAQDGEVLADRLVRQGLQLPR